MFCCFIVNLFDRPCVLAGTVGNTVLIRSHEFELWQLIFLEDCKV